MDSIKIKYFIMDLKDIILTKGGNFLKLNVWEEGKFSITIKEINVLFMGKVTLLDQPIIASLKIVLPIHWDIRMNKF